MSDEAKLNQILEELHRLKRMLEALTISVDQIKREARERAG